MLILTVQIEDAATSALQRTMARLDAATELHEAMGVGVKQAAVDHLVATKNSPNTGWWGRAARMVSHTATATEATVIYNQRGVALRYHGGTVKKKVDGPLLTIPLATVPVVDGTRKPARMMGSLAFISARKGHRRGLLVEGEAYTPKKGKHAGQERTRPKKGGQLYYVLMDQVTHQPDPTVLPTEKDLSAAAVNAAEEYLTTAD
ncbi:MAG: hypothetical protein JNK37_21215 [Verrucomicrobiales bacterium]|nr:hypothetical protein [Verrucomicrobiales bacterium]